MDKYNIDQILSHIKNIIEGYSKTTLNNTRPIASNNILFEALIKKKISQVSLKDEYLILAETTFSLTSIILSKNNIIKTKDRYFLCYPINDVSSTGITKFNTNLLRDNLFDYIYAKSDIAKAIKMNQSKFSTALFVKSDEENEILLCRDNPINVYDDSYIRSHPDDTKANNINNLEEITITLDGRIPV